LIEKIPDKKIQRTLLGRIEGLSDAPDKQGKILVKELSGFRSIHAAGRDPIICKIDKQTLIIYILAFGIRKPGDKKDKEESDFCPPQTKKLPLGDTGLIPGAVYIAVFF